MVKINVLHGIPKPRVKMGVKSRAKFMNSRLFVLSNLHRLASHDQKKATINRIVDGFKSGNSPMMNLLFLDQRLAEQIIRELPEELLKQTMLDCVDRVTASHKRLLKEMDAEAEAAGKRRYILGIDIGKKRITIFLGDTAPRLSQKEVKLLIRDTQILPPLARLIIDSLFKEKKRTVMKDFPYEKLREAESRSNYYTMQSFNEMIEPYRR